MDEQVDTQGLINKTFEECNDPYLVDGRLYETLAEAFAVADNIHKEC